MNIKSLLLGSAAALAAVSGARAADAVMAEPEAVEYVRVCDAYGAGYFYIPGTETCLKIGGYIRYQIGAGTGLKGFTKHVEARVEVYAKNDSELGTISSYVRLAPSVDSGRITPLVGPLVPGGPVTGGNFDSAFDYGNVQNWGANYQIDIGGLSMGAHDSLTNQFFGFGAGTDNGSGGYGYSYQYRHFIGYTYKGSAMSAYVTLDHDGSADYIPDVAIGVKGNIGSVEVGAGVGFDTSNSAQTFRAQVSAPIGPANLKIQAFYNNGASSYYYGDASGTWSVNAGISAPVSAKLSLGATVQYIDDKTVGGYGKAWGFTGDVKYDIAPGIFALLEYNHSRARGLGAYTNSGFLRFQRSW
jgi:Porin subfamily